MRPYLKAFLFFAMLFAASHVVRLIVTPGVAPVADNEQPTLKFLSAFVLKSLENIGLYGTVIVLLFGVGWLLSSFLPPARR